jgi:hypothetical protein
VIHFRIASVGGVCDELRHPFPVTKKARLDDRGRTGAVLFQNGTWGQYDEALRFAASEGHVIPEGEMSDTRAAAFLCSIYGHKFLAKCGCSRWVYFSAKETVRVGDWYKRDGIYFSNLYWLPPPPPKRPETHSKRYHEAEQFAFPKTKMDREIRELWDMGSIESYWAKLHAHNDKLRARVRAGQKPCNLCEGLGHREVAGRDAKCELCHGTGVQPKALSPS